MSNDPVQWRVHAHVDKWSLEQVADVSRTLGREPTAEELVKHYEPEMVDQDGNLLTTGGLTRIMSLLIAAGGQAMDNTHTRLGVGNSSTAEAIGQTDLQAASGTTNRYFMTMTATYPSVVAAVATFKASFASADGNFAWNEWGITIDSSSSVASSTVGATLVNRKVASLGTKGSGSVWVLQVTLTLS
jgi:general stress protein CsbA